jgi:ABC-type nitrate/sulfonate/bicarbonate transport system permease component
MRGLLQEGAAVRCSRAPSAARRLPYTLEMIRAGRAWVGVHTHLANAFAARMLGASSRLILTHVVIPYALPFVLAGARLSLGVAWAAMVAAELTGSDAGLGWRLFWYQEFFAMDKVMAVILTIGVLGYLMDLLLRKLQSRITRWSRDSAIDEAR